MQSFLPPDSGKAVNSNKSDCVTRSQNGSMESEFGWEEGRKEGNKRKREKEREK